MPLSEFTGWPAACCRHPAGSRTSAFLAIASILLLTNCSESTRQSMVTTLYQRSEYRFNETLLSKPEFESLVKTEAADSLYDFLSHNILIDSSVTHIDTVLDEKTPHAAPDKDLTLDKLERVLILLMNTDSTLAALILNKEFDKGHYRFYFNLNIWQDLYLNGASRFMTLDIVGNNFEYREGIFLR